MSTLKLNKETLRVLNPIQSQFVYGRGETDSVDQTCMTQDSVCDSVCDCDSIVCNAKSTYPQRASTTVVKPLTN